jgi:hypothetical protein
VPGEAPRARIKKVYGRAHAARVIRASMADYAEHYAAT